MPRGLHPDRHLSDAGAAQQADGGHFRSAACDPTHSPQAAAVHASQHLRTPFKADMVSWHIYRGLAITESWTAAAV